MRRSILLALALALAAPFVPHAAGAQGVSSEAVALTRFNRGRELFLARDYAAALMEFRAANELVPSPNTRLYIARSLREMGRLAEAYTEFQRAAAEAADRARTEPRYAATRDAARAEGSALEARVGRLVLYVPDAPEGTSVTVNGVVVPGAAWGVPMPIDPGRVEITATAPGRLPFRSEVEVHAGQTAEASVNLAPAPSAGRNEVPQGSATNSDAERPPSGEIAEEPPSPRTVLVRREVGGSVRTVGIVLTAGFALAGGAGFAIFGSLAANRYADLQAYCGAAPCPSSVESQITEGEQYQLLANISLFGGIAGVAIGTVMVIFGGPTTVEQRVQARDERGTSVLRPSASLWGAPLGQAGGVLGVRGAF